jgi:hypothetical protein
MMATCDCARALTKPVGTENLASDRANELFIGSSITGAAQ